MGYSDYIKECQEQMKKAMEALDSLVDEEKCCCDCDDCCCEDDDEDIVPIKLRIFAETGSIDIDNVAYIEQVKDNNITLFDEDHELIGVFYKDKIVGMQRICNN